MYKFLLFPYFLFFLFFITILLYTASNAAIVDVAN